MKLIRLLAMSCAVIGIVGCADSSSEAIKIKSYEKEFNDLIGNNADEVCESFEGNYCSVNVKKCGQNDPISCYNLLSLFYNELKGRPAMVYHSHSRNLFAYSCREGVFFSEKNGNLVVSQDETEERHSMCDLLAELNKHESICEILFEEERKNLNQDDFREFANNANCVDFNANTLEGNKWHSIPKPRSERMSFEFFKEGKTLILYYEGQKILGSWNKLNGDKYKVAIISFGRTLDFPATLSGGVLTMDFPVEFGGTVQFEKRLWPADD